MASGTDGADETVTGRDTRVDAASAGGEICFGISTALPEKSRDTATEGARPGIIVMHVGLEPEGEEARRCLRSEACKGPICVWAVGNAGCRAEMFVLDASGDESANEMVEERDMSLPAMSKTGWQRRGQIGRRHEQIRVRACMSAGICAVIEIEEASSTTALSSLRVARLSSLRVATWWKETKKRVGKKDLLMPSVQLSSGRVSNV
ncbi:hypothetical protein FB45DRAFT_1010026 [Roridomyces roridus]|uniref:Uncharacterized protein n=1 Tax=Roridomyces roridus TaxID=1738132 RepID=A0AAD7B553_9AGAR|nr:hypothetical protein FB45DRAFT_1010026 [Roridomyces roridus]